MTTSRARTRTTPVFAVAMALTWMLAPAAAWCAPAAAPVAQSAARDVNGSPLSAEPMSFVFRDTPIVELFEMLARKERINIVLGRGVTGNVAVNLYNMSARQAIMAIAEAGGYAVTARENGYYIGDPKALPPTAPGVRMQVRSMPVQYSDPKQIATILARHVSPGGSVTVLEERRMLVVEDTPEGLLRIASVLHEIDAQPRQIMIEAKILEITLDNTETFGIDWAKIFNAKGTNRIGTTGLAKRGSGLALNFVNANVELYLNALADKGRVRTLATPKLLTLENLEAVTNIGDKLGYRLTTTINNVTTESIQFLDTGVILRVTPSVDGAGRIVMKVRPEVSSGSVSGGIPSKKTTEVSTQLVAADGQAVLIAGLIKNTATYRRTGIPLLGDLPGLGRLFSGTEEGGVVSETVVMITARIVNPDSDEASAGQVRDLNEQEALLRARAGALGRTLDGLAPADTSP